jgi:hypothetical protein
MRPGLVVPIAALLLAGCGEKSDPDKVAQAFSIESKQQRDVEAARAAKASQDAEAHERARSEAQQLQAAIDASAVLPNPLPADGVAACDAVVEAYDAFMKGGSEADQLAWSDGRRRKLGERRTACAKVSNLRVAACEARALANPPASFGERDRAEAARMLMERCHEKFGSA